MAADNFQLESKTNQGVKLVVEMSLVTDRFVTVLQAISAAGTIPLLRSVEGTPDEIWPANGPLQEVLPQTNKDGAYLAGVGRAGKSHWSTIVSSTGAGAGIEFDFACRSKTAPDWLGSTYQVMIGSSANATDNRIEFEIPGGAGRLACRALDSTQLMPCTDQLLRFVPAASEAVFPRTDRWKYSFELA